MKTNLNINIATDEYGKDLIIDLAKINHLLIAGNTGSGKSVILHNILSTLISNNSPEKLKLVLIDTKQVELNMYNGIPHLLTPVINEEKKSILAMKWASKEISRRFDVLVKNDVRNIEEYHKDILEPILLEQSKKTKPEPDTDLYYQSGSIPESLPYIVIVIDELSVLMSVYPKETEQTVVKIIEKGHIVGIQMVISTSRPNKKVLTKSVQDLIGARIALQTTLAQDSKSIIGTGDACGLKGEGHMLYREGMKYIIRGQSPFISIEEIKKAVKIQADAYRDEIIAEVNLETPNVYTSDGKAIFDARLDSDEDDTYDEMYEEAKQVVIESGKASTSYIQRKLGVGYSRAAYLMDLLEQREVIGPANGSKAREVFESKK